jgi:heme oxygenase
MLSEKLKEQTQQNHQYLEKMMVKDLKAIRTNGEYEALLQKFYSYFGGLEVKIDEVFDQSQLPDAAERRKAQALANDIKFFGGTVADKAAGKSLPTINNHLQALGALYVIEGSTLGGKIISKMMQQQLGLANDGVTFFEGYGDQSMQMWGIFKEMLNTQATNPEQEAVVITAANETFRKFGDWFKNSEN